MNYWQIAIATLMAPLPLGVVALAIFGFTQAGKEKPGGVPNEILALLLLFAAGGLVLIVKCLVDAAA